MEKYIEIIKRSFSGYLNYLVQEISNPSWTNYFTRLLGLSLLVFLLEIIVPWRQKQPIIRKGFWLDTFYILFNFFLFSLIGYNALSNVGGELFNDFLGIFGIKNIVAVEVQDFPVWMQILIMFIVSDFVQWNVHRMLHRVPWMWKFHNLHHSVKEMGFAAQFRFHFLKTIVYKSIQYIPLAMIGFGIEQFFVVHMFTVFVGHLNHANLDWSYGKFGYVLNNPRCIYGITQKHCQHPYEMNFGLTLSIWDYLFRTAYVPKIGRDIELGFEDDGNFPNTF